MRKSPYIPQWTLPKYLAFQIAVIVVPAAIAISTLYILVEGVHTHAPWSQCSANAGKNANELLVRIIRYGIDIVSVLPKKPTKVTACLGYSTECRRNAFWNSIHRLIILKFPARHCLHRRRPRHHAPGRDKWFIPFAGTHPSGNLSRRGRYGLRKRRCIFTLSSA